MAIINNGDKHSDRVDNNMVMQCDDDDGGNS